MVAEGLSGSSTQAQSDKSQVGGHSQHLTHIVPPLPLTPNIRSVPPFSCSCVSFPLPPALDTHLLSAFVPLLLSVCLPVHLPPLPDGSQMSGQSLVSATLGSLCLPITRGVWNDSLPVHVSRLCPEDIFRISQPFVTKFCVIMSHSVIQKNWVCYYCSWPRQLVL